MNGPDLTSRYNYDEFTPDNVLPWLNFGASPPLGIPAPDFPLWHLDEAATTGPRAKGVMDSNRLSMVNSTAR
jgi:hypothetical protein